MKCSNCGSEINDKMSKGLSKVLYCIHCSSRGKSKNIIAIDKCAFIPEDIKK